MKEREIILKGLEHLREDKQSWPNDYEFTEKEIDDLIDKYED